MSVQMDQSVNWVTKHITDVPGWAKYMVCERGDRYHGYFFEKKPQFDKRQGIFYSNGGRNEKFNTEALSWSIRYNLSNGHLRVMETGETTSLHEDIDAEDDTVFRCGWCKYQFTRSGEYSATVSQVDSGYTTVNIDYDIQCFQCSMKTTVRVKVLSPLSIVNSPFTNLT